MAPIGVAIIGGGIFVKENHLVGPLPPAPVCVPRIIFPFQ